MSPSLMIYFDDFSFFLSYLFGVKKTNTFIRSCGSLEKPYPISVHNGQNLYPFSNQIGSKTTPLPFGAAHTYIADMGEYHPPPPSRLLMVV